jgi:hypothetical protein
MEMMKRRGNQLSNGRHWTTGEVSKAREMAGKVHSKQIARLLDRSYESLRQMAKREHISLRCQ